MLPEALLWLVLSTTALIYIQRGFLHHVHGVLLIIFRTEKAAVLVFSLVFFPGILLHEGSHWLMAKMMGVPTLSFSIVPRRLKPGRTELGHVHIARTTWLRVVLISAAPLILGLVCIAGIGFGILNLDNVFTAILQGDLILAQQYWEQVLRVPENCIWFYLLITFSNSILPSKSDRRSWLPAGLLLVLIVSITLIAAEMLTVREIVVAYMVAVLNGVSAVFSLTVILDTGLMLPLVLVQWVGVKMVGTGGRYR